jgi:hypothetical protein
VLQGDRVAVVAQGPWLGRDGFVAETAVQFDRVQASIARLERELEKSRQLIAEMAEEAGRTRRFQSFEDTLKNSRDYKLGDLQRGLRDLKVRLDAIEGERSTFAGLTYKSFEAIDKKLTELNAMQGLVARAETSVRRSTMLFIAVAAIAFAAIAAHILYRTDSIRRLASGLSHSAGPIRRPISRPCASMRIDVGMPMTFSSLPWRAVGSA